MKKIVLISFVTLILLSLTKDIFLDIYYQSQGEAYYQKEEFISAIESFEKVSDIPTSYHNIGNSLYQLGISADGNEKRQMFLKALDLYSGSLSVEENNMTRYNHDYIEKLLQEEQQNDAEEDTQEQQQEESSLEQENNQSEEQESVESQDESTSEKEQEQSVSQQRGDEYRLSEEEGISEITESEKQILEHHIDSLKKQQEQNQRFFGKQDDVFQQRDVFDSFFENPFFGNSVGNGGEKDW